MTFKGSHHGAMRNPLDAARDKLALSLLWNVVQGFGNFVLLMVLYLELYK